MIQELFGGSNVGIIGGDQRNKFDGPPSHNSASGSPSPAAASAAAATAPENLRCPRCASSNTKFCYYNNYNLTQPRHFCKTCRRYWTKGGALRNVPIGGGCRKNKNATITATVGKSAPAGPKVKTMSSEMLRTGLLTDSSNPIIWASSQNSHFLSLLRSNQNPNPQNAMPVKEESPASLFTPPHMKSDAVGARALGLDHLSPAQLPSPFYRGMYGEEGLRSSVNCYADHAPLILGNMTSATSGILDSSPVTAGEMGFWNPSTLSWPTDSAYP